MEPREGDIADGPDGQYMVFRGGQWHPSDANGRPQGRVPRPDFGANHFELPNGNIVRVNRTTGTEAVVSKPDARADGRGSAALRSLQNADRSRRVVVDEIERALRLAGHGETGAVGAVASRLPGTQAHDLAALIDTIKANVGFGYLQAMREASPTGGALGNVSNIENELLQATSGNLSLSQSRDQLRTNLSRLLDLVNTSFDQSVSQYEAQFGPWEGRGTDGSEGGPGADHSSAIDWTDPNNRDALAGLIATGGWLREGDGEPYYVGPGGITTARQEGDEAVSPGVMVRRQADPENAVDRYNDRPGWAQRLESGIHTAADMLSFGMADEAVAGVDAALGRGGDGSFGERFSRLRGVNQDWRETAQSDHPVSAFAGGAGAVAATLPIAAAGAAPTMGANVLRGAGAGAGYGGAYGLGSGQGNILERVPNALGGAAIGGVTGAAALPVANALSRYVAAPVAQSAQSAGQWVGRQIGRAGETLGVPGADRLTAVSSPNALQQAIGTFARRSPQDVNALTGNAQRFRDAGIDPTFADVTNSGGRGVLRATASRQTPARQAAEDFAAGRAEAMPSRVSYQARRNISQDTRSPDQIQEALRTRRTTQADQDYGAITARVPLDDAMMSGLSDEPGMAAIRAARRGAVERRDTATVNELDGLIADINLRNELAGMGLGRMPRTQTQDLSAMTVERLRRAMGERAAKMSRAGNMEQASGAMARRGDIEQALDGVPEAAAARGNYRALSRQIDAVDAGGQFLNRNTDDFVSSVAGISPEERAVALPAAARAVEIAAQGSGSAPGVARSLAANPEQLRRSEALLGPDGARRLANGMRAEADALEAARQINPRAGSNTALNQQDAANAAGEAIGAVRDIATANLPGIGVRILTRLQSRGFSDDQADAIVRAAIDPTQTDALIAMLSERMSRRDARNLARQIRYQVTTGLQSGQSQ